MLKIQFINKYNYIVYRNSRALEVFDSKKTARDYLFKIKRDFELLHKQQNLFFVYPVLFEQGYKLVVFFERRQTFNDPLSSEFRDTYRIVREINPDY